MISGSYLNSCDEGKSSVVEAVHLATFSMHGSLCHGTYVRPVWECGGTKVTKLGAGRMQAGGYR